MKIMPGVRIRASSRGFSVGVGPRVARVHVGTRGVGVSTGVGPFGAYGHLGGGGSRQRASGGGYARAHSGPSRATLAALERETRQAEKEEQVRKIAAIERRLVSVHRERFPEASTTVLPAPKPVDRDLVASTVFRELAIPDLAAQLDGTDQPPTAPVPEPVDLSGLVSEGESRALEGIGLFRRTERKGAKERARQIAEERAEQLAAERARAAAGEQQRLDELWATLQAKKADATRAIDEELARLVAEAHTAREREQAALDAEWHRLSDNEPAIVITALETAFADNGAPATPLDCDAGSATATVTMLYGHPDLIPERTGNHTRRQADVAQAQQSDRNDLYLNALASNVLATAKEGHAVAPGLSAIKILVVRRDPFATGQDQLVAIYAAAIHASHARGSQLEQHQARQPVGRSARRLAAESEGPSRRGSAS